MPLKTYTCALETCSATFQRYDGSVRDPTTACCSKSCASRLAKGQAKRLQTFAAKRPSAKAVANALAETRSVLGASRLLGVSRSTVYKVVDSASLNLVGLAGGNGRPHSYEQVFRLKEPGEGPRPHRYFKRLTDDRFYCWSCSLPPEWQGLPLTLHLDHVNGNPWDDRFENLRWLCPNCHTQTPTYVGKKRAV